jgi:hypothetical protein
LKISTGIKISNPNKRKKNSWQQVIINSGLLNSYSLQTNIKQKLQEEKSRNLEN